MTESGGENMAQKRSDNIWVFNAGNNFSGNPKWLFLHILKNRPEITPYWLCYDKKLVRYMKSRGYKAALYDSRDGKIIASQAGVYVVNQMKEVFQDELQDIKILNLWHGVGCKSIERKLVSGILDEKVFTLFCGITSGVCNCACLPFSVK